MGKEKMDLMPKKGYKPMGKLGEMDKSKLPFRNSQIESRNIAYDRQTKKDEGVEIGENSMFTGNAWFDIGLGLGRRARAKKAAKLTK